MFFSVALVIYFSIMKLLDLNSWNRKDHFEFFKNYDQPFFGITADLDVSKAHLKAKEIGASFFLYYLHKTLTVINKLAPFRYRILNDKVVIYDEIRAGATINRPDSTFSFSYLPYHKNFAQFQKEATVIIENIRLTSGLPHTDRSQDVAYFSAIPWVKFTSIEHAMNSKTEDSVPKIAFGKWENKEGKKLMPVSVHVHHALMDGVHVGQFYELLQQLLDEE